MTTAAAQPAPDPNDLLALADDALATARRCMQLGASVSTIAHEDVVIVLAAALRAAATTIERYRQAAVELRDARAMWRYDLSESAAVGYSEAIEAVCLLAAPSDAAGVVSATDVLGIAEGTERGEWGDRQWQDSEGDAQEETE